MNTRADPALLAHATQTIAVGGTPAGMAYDGHTLWVVSPLGQALSRIDPATGRVERAQTLNDPAASVTTDGSTVWAASPNTGTVIALDGATGKDKAFYEGKVASARWFAASVFPELTAKRAIAEAVDLSLMDLDESAF